MRYFANPSTPAIVDAMKAGRFGCISTPGQRNAIPEGVAWCADNGAYGANYVGDERWLAWLASRTADRSLCAFATAPDVVGDAAATLARSRPFLPQIRALGYPAALVAQDGLEALSIPWDEFDVLFIGGSTEWKLGEHAAEIARQAHAHGKPVHMGRVNSRRRLAYAHSIGCASVDGTFLTFGPTKNIERMTRYLTHVLGEAS